MKKGRVIINRNVCDNAQECSGILVCPTEALYWDEQKEEIAYNPNKCIDCGACADASADGCPIGAIRWAVDDAEYEKIKKEVEEETMSLEELEVERYGATPIEPYIQLEEATEFIANVTQKYLILELFNDDSINCLLHSIRAEEIKKALVGDVCYKKVYVEDKENVDFAQITILPSLVVLKGISVKMVISGYYDDANKEKLFELIRNALKDNN